MSFDQHAAPQFVNDLGSPVFDQPPVPIVSGIVFLSGLYREFKLKLPETPEPGCSIRFHSCDGNPIKLRLVNPEENRALYLNGERSDLDDRSWKIRPFDNVLAVFVRRDSLGDHWILSGHEEEKLVGRSAREVGGPQDPRRVPMRF